MGGVGGGGGSRCGWGGGGTLESTKCGFILSSEC